MNWKLILQLSLFGLAMGIATVYVISSRIEPAFWLVIFLICAYAIAKRTSAHFLHGLLLGIANSIWITAAHVLLFNRYIATHSQEAAAMQQGPLAAHPRMMMLIVGPLIGVVSGLVIGLFAFIAGKLIKTPSVPESKATA